MTSVLVTGSSRGIGLELVKALATHPNHPDIVIATCRDPSKADELVALSGKYPHVKILQLDVDNFDKYPEYVSQVGSIVGENGLNILLNNAGVCAEKVGHLEDLKYDFYCNTIKTNLFAPVFLTQAFLPLLKRAASLKKSSATGFKQVAVLNMSSLLGSVSSDKAFVCWGYCESKAALNQATRLMASNLNPHGILAVALHPGWVRTDMGGPDALLSPGESISGMMNIITNLSQESNDKFLSHTGEYQRWTPEPWERVMGVMNGRTKDVRGNGLSLDETRDNYGRCSVVTLT